jgi:hypothetical protein
MTQSLVIAAEIVKHYESRRVVNPELTTQQTVAENHSSVIRFGRAPSAPHFGSE